MNYYDIPVTKDGWIKHATHYSTNISYVPTNLITTELIYQILLKNPYTPEDMAPASREEALVLFAKTSPILFYKLPMDLVTIELIKIAMSNSSDFFNIADFSLSKEQLKYVLSSNEREI